MVGRKGDLGFTIWLSNTTVTKAFIVFDSVYAAKDTACLFMV